MYGLPGLYAQVGPGVSSACRDDQERFAIDRARVHTRTTDDFMARGPGPLPQAMALQVNQVVRGIGPCDIHHAFAKSHHP